MLRFASRFVSLSPTNRLAPTPCLLPRSSAALRLPLAACFINYAASVRYIWAARPHAQSLSWQLSPSAPLASKCESETFWLSNALGSTKFHIRFSLSLCFVLLHFNEVSTIFEVSLSFCFFFFFLSKIKFNFCCISWAPSKAIVCPSVCVWAPRLHLKCCPAWHRLYGTYLETSLDATQEVIKHEIALPFWPSQIELVYELGLIERLWLIAPGLSSSRLQLE